MRVSGSQWLAGLGLDVFKIQLLGRWSSDVVLRYVRDAPLKIVSADYRRLMASRDLESVLSCIGSAASAEQVRLLEQKISEVEARALAEEAVLRRELAAVQSLCGPGGYIRNDSDKHDSRAVHVAAVDGVNVPSRSWRTKCGWRFGQASFTRVTCLPPRYTDICDKCLPVARRSAKILAGDVSEDDE